MSSDQDLIEFIDILRSEDTQTEWLEFKPDYISDQDIGECISALSNGAALQGRPYGYLILGVTDETHEVVGTAFGHQKTRQGNDDVENGLNRLIEPHADYSVFEVKYAALKKVVVFEIPAAYTQPTAFAGKKYMRVDGYRRDLSRYPETEKRLRTALTRISWERMPSPVQNLHFSVFFAHS